MFVGLTKEMASAGTLLSDLDQKATVPEDAQFVQRILADMNQPTSNSGGNQIVYPGGQPPGTGFMPGSNQVINSPNPNLVSPNAMDPSTATAHLIGKDSPTPGDFARMMYAGGNGGNEGTPVAVSMGPQYQGAPYTQPMQYASPPQLNTLPVQQSWFSGLFKDIGSHFRLPLLVSIIIFVMSLPVINVLIAHYIPYLIMPSGQMSQVGLIAKSVLGGFLFWILYKVIIPLGSGAI